MVINRQRRVPIAIKPLENFLHRVQRTLRMPDRQVAVCLISDTAMARMNRTFRGKRGPTDVLSFPTNANGAHAPKHAKETKQTRHRAKSEREISSSTSLASFPSSASYLGDIAISPQAARRNARRLSRPLPQEMRILILHGMLHLAGYDHETDNGEMSRLEGRLRRRLKLV